MRTASTLIAFLALGLPVCAQTSAFHVSGQVVDEDHQPLPGVQLRVGLRGKGRVVGTTGADGRFRVRLPDHGDDSIFSRMTEYMDLEAEGRLIARTMVGRQSVYGFRRRNLGGQDLGTVVLPKGKPIQVRVRKNRGRPLSGAVVLADSALPVSPLPFIGFGFNSGIPIIDYFSRAVTDEKGAAVIYGCGDEGIAVVVEAEGYYRKHLRFHGPGMPLVVVMEEGGFVSGKVVDHEGKPVRALLSLLAEVEPVSYAHTLTMGASGSRSFTAEDGSFRLNLAYRHRYCIMANMIRGTSLYVHPAKSSEVLTGPQQDVVIQLDKPKGVEGGVVVHVMDSESGKPVVGFRAAALWQNLQHLTDVALEAQFEGSALKAREKGRILLPPPPTGAQHTGGVMIKADGYATTLIKDVEWDQDQPVKVEAKLHKELPVHGSVVDEKTGKPVVGALVWAVRKGQRAGSIPMSFPFEQHPAAVLTDAKGRFRLRGLGKGKHRLHASHPTHPDLKPKTVDLNPDEPLAPLTLQMSPGFRLVGRIKGGEHRPGWKLRLVAKSAQAGQMGLFGSIASGPTMLTEIGADGRFALTGLKEGDYTAYLVVPSLVGPVMQIEIPSEIEVQEDRENVEIDITKALPGHVHGKVAVTGIPAPPGRMVLVAENIGSSPDGLDVFVSLGANTMNGPRTTIRRDGTFAQELAPGKYRLKVVDAGTGVILWQGEEQVEIEAGRSSRHEINLDLVLVRVRLVPKTENGRIVAAELGVKVDWPQLARRALAGMVVHEIGMDLGAPGVQLADGQREIHLYLPPRQTTLQVQSSVQRLRQGPQQAKQPPPLAEYRFTPRTGETNRVEIKVSSPPVIEDDR